MEGGGNDGSGGGGHGRRSPLFFKVFLPGLYSEKLWVPPAFQARFMTGKLSGSAACSFVGPSGNAWTVDLVKSEAGAFFETGWKEFVHDHSLSTGEFLVFEYDGNRRFLVSIFDTSTCQKEAAYHAQPSQVMSAAAAAAAKSLREDSRAISKKENKTSEGNSGAQGKTNISGSKRVSSEGCEAEELHTPSCSTTHKKKNNLMVSKTPKVGIVWVSQRRPVTEEEVESALNQATSFKSRNPCRVLVMRNSSVSFGHRMIIPVSDAHCFPEKTTRLTLHGPCGGDSWEVTFCRDKIRRSYLTAGWLKFSVGNHLEENDACVFEFVKPDEVRVHVFRVVDEIAPCVRTTARSRR